MGILLSIWSNFYFQSFFKIILIIVLAGIIGKERDNSNKPAGFRIYTLLGLGAVLVVICGEFLSQRYDVDPFRIAAQFLSGIGFIGAGTILRDGFNVKGLTTASGLFTVSCIGLCVGAGFYFAAVIATIFTYLILSTSYIFTDGLENYDIIELELDIKDSIINFKKELQKISRENDVDVKQIKDITDEDKEYNSLKVILKYNSRKITRNKIFYEISILDKICNINEV